MTEIVSLNRTLDQELLALMGLDALISVGAVLLVAARAVNVLGS